MIGTKNRKLLNACMSAKNLKAERLILDAEEEAKQQSYLTFKDEEKDAYKQDMGGHV